MQFRQVSKSEYNTLANIHFITFHFFFLTSLGKRFLRSYYKACLKSKKSNRDLLQLMMTTRWLVFSIGSIQSKGFHRGLVRTNILLFLIQGIMILFTKPKLCFVFSKIWIKKGNNKDDGNYAELLSIAVSPIICRYGLR